MQKEEQYHTYLMDFIIVIETLINCPTSTDFNYTNALFRL